MIVFLALLDHAKKSMLFISDASREKQMLIDKMKSPQTIEGERCSISFCQRAKERAGMRVIRVDAAVTEISYE